jgi:hypothetical protein
MFYCILNCAYFLQHNFLSGYSYYTLSINYYMFRPLVYLQETYIHYYGRSSQYAQYLMIVERSKHIEVYIQRIIYLYGRLC